MKKVLKSLIIGILVTALLLSITFARGTKETIEVMFNAVNLTVNRQKVDADTIVYNGTTYVPLRAAAEMLGKEVGWDQKTQTASINDKINTEADIKVEVVKLENVKDTKELINYLEDNFSILDTVIGSTSFTFYIMENDSTILPFDYWIQVGFDSQYFSGAQYSKKYTDVQKDTLKAQLKNHMESIGKAAIKAMPDKKLYGGYYDSWYKYPDLKLELITRHYFSWTNYEQGKQAIPSTFRWYDAQDDKL